jgi:hypothetical protein
MIAGQSGQDGAALSPMTAPAVLPGGGFTPTSAPLIGPIERSITIEEACPW